MPGAKATDVLGLDIEALRCQMGAQFAGAISPLRVVKQIKQHRDFPPIDMPECRPARLGSAELVEEGHSLADVVQQTSVPEANYGIQQGNRSIREPGRDPVASLRCTPIMHEKERPHIEG